MGRLYNRLDLEWNTQYWHLRDQRLTAMIARGEVDAGILNEVITERGKHDGACYQGCGCRSYRLANRSELMLRREKYRLLRTGELLAERKKQEALFKACPHCYVGISTRGRWKGKQVDRPCSLHEEGLKLAKLAIKWAGDRNAQERSDRRYELLGERRRFEGWNQERYLREAALVEAELEKLQSAAEPGHELNEWEKLYWQNVREGSWPADAERPEYQTTPDYKGWLWTMRFEEEMTEAEYLAELERIRTTLADNEVNTKTVAGSGAKLTRRMRLDDGERPARRADNLHLELLQRFQEGKL